MLAKLRDKILPEAKDMLTRVGKGEGSNYPSSIAKVNFSSEKFFTFPTNRRALSLPKVSRSNRHDEKLFSQSRSECDEG